MELEKAIEGRRAYFPKEYTGEKVATDHIERMLELANWAPTHKRTEPWRFFVFESEGLDRFITELNELYVRRMPSERFKPEFTAKMDQRKAQLSHLIVLAYERHTEIPEFEEIAAMSMAVQNMWLYASSQGIGAYWSSPEIALSPLMNQHPSLPDNLHYCGIFYVGALEPEADQRIGQRGNWKEKVVWVKN